MTGNNFVLFEDGHMGNLCSARILDRNDPRDEARLMYHTEDFVDIACIGDVVKTDEGIIMCVGRVHPYRPKR